MLPTFHMLPFPTEEALLGEMVRMYPVASDIERQNAMAEFLVDFVHKHDLGNARLVPFPSDAVYGKHEPKPCNVVVNVPTPNGVPEEIQGWYGHFDVVPYSEGQAEGLSRDLHNPNLWYGRGAGDMLVGIEAMLFALRGIATRKVQMWSRRAIRLILTCREEEESAGFWAAQRSGLFHRVDHVITPEILTNTKRADLTKKRVLIVARPGRFGFNVIINGLEEHMGAVDDEDTPQLTESLFDIAQRVVRNLNNVLRSNLTRTRGVLLHPRCVAKEWASHGKPSLTTPYGAHITANVHYAHHGDSPEDIISKVRDDLYTEALQVFHGFPDCKERAACAFRVEVEVHGSPTYGVTPFTKPWMELNEPLIAKMLTEVIPAANAACDDRRYDGDKPEGEEVTGDTGVADCGLIANEVGIPVVGVPPVAFGAHTPNEHVDIRCREFLTRVFGHTAQYEGRLASRQ